MKKRLFLAVILGALLMPITANAGQWEQGDFGKQYYQKDNGQYAQGEWENIEGKDYYFTLNCEMLANNYTPDGYWVDGNGVWDQSVGQRQVDAYPAWAMYVNENENEIVSYSFYYYDDYSDGISIAEVQWLHSSLYYGNTYLSYLLKDLGNGTFILLSQNGDKLYYDSYITVTPDGQYLLVSSCGSTEVYYLAEELIYS